jgi:hypothetical protein
MPVPFLNDINSISAYSLCVLENNSEGDDLVIVLQPVHNQDRFAWVGLGDGTLGNYNITYHHDYSDPFIDECDYIYILLPLLLS